MKTVAFTDFRRHASGLFSKVEAGETLLVLRHGRPIAEIGPVSPAEPHAPAWKRPGVRLVTQGARLSEAILEARNREGVL